jgi:hypothetical protein
MTKNDFKGVGLILLGLIVPGVGWLMIVGGIGLLWKDNKNEETTIQKE